VTDTTGEEIVQMRSIFTPQGGDFAQRAGKLPRCTPRIYIDGHYMPISAFEVDGMVRPNEVAGIEVYMPGTVPAEFTEAFDACGAIVIWTKHA
jgi:hypothetical protein